MILEWQTELELFLRALLLGIVLRALYDLCLIRRSFYRKTSHLLFDSAEDLMYWLFCGVAVFMLMYRYNSGIPRAFLYLALALGMLLYHFGPSSYVVGGAHRILGWIGKILQRYIKKPLWFIGKRLQNSLKSIRIKRRKRKERIAGEKKKKKAAGKRK